MVVNQSGKALYVDDCNITSDVVMHENPDCLVNDNAMIYYANFFIFLDLKIKTEVVFEYENKSVKCRNVSGTNTSVFWYDGNR